jgi:predicted Zn-dependent protease
MSTIRRRPPRTSSPPCRRALHVAAGFIAAWACASAAAQISPPAPAASASLEEQGIEQYRQALAQARARKQLALPTHPQQVRLNYILERLIHAFPMTTPWGARAATWHWEIALLGSSQVNAYALPGGKVVVYWGLIDKLKLSDAELAAVVGQQVASAQLVRAPQPAGLDLGATGTGTDLGRESDRLLADRIGLDLTARAGYDPLAALSMWDKMNGAGSGGSAVERRRALERGIAAAQALYEHAPRPACSFGPPGTPGAGCPSASSPEPAQPASEAS